MKWVHNRIVFRYAFYFFFFAGTGGGGGSGKLLYQSSLLFTVCNIFNLKNHCSVRRVPFTDLHARLGCGVHDIAPMFLYHERQAWD